MARNTLKLDTTGFESMLRKLDALGGNVREAVQEALTKAGETISSDTVSALDAANLPAGGHYSDGNTRESVIRDAQVRWEGLTGYIPVGFDFSKPGAGGFLITGTPRMRPDAQLQKMYKQKKYMNQIQKDISNIILDYVIEAMEK